MDVKVLRGPDETHRPREGVWSFSGCGNEVLRFRFSADSRCCRNDALRSASFEYELLDAFSFTDFSGVNVAV